MTKLNVVIGSEFRIFIGSEGRLNRTHVDQHIPGCERSHQADIKSASKPSSLRNTSNKGASSYTDIHTYRHDVRSAYEAKVVGGPIYWRDGSAVGAFPSPAVGGDNGLELTRSTGCTRSISRSDMTNVCMPLISAGRSRTPRRSRSWGF